MLLLVSFLFIFLSFLFLWSLVIASKNSKTIEEQYIDDNLQMQFLKNFIKK